jgi:hypothetical protein
VSFTYDPGTDAGKVRLLISDTQTSSHIFEDTEIASFLDIQGDPRLAAAMALEAIAASQILLLKVIGMTNGISTHGDKVADSLRALANSIRKRVDDDYAFDWAEMVTNSFSERDRIYKQFLRGAI